MRGSFSSSMAPCAAVLLAVLVAAAGAQAQGEECLANPTVAGCENYTVHEAVLQHDLARLCASAALGDRTWSGWPAACTLWHECQSGRGSGAACSPMRLMQTACGEAMLTPGTPSEVCTSYVMLCAPQSVVQQCKAQPALDSLRPAMQLFTAARKLCGGSSAGAQAPTAAPARDRVGVAAQDLPPAPAAADAAGACSRCSSQSFDPNKVTVQAVQSNCPDPLGTLSALCLESSENAHGEACAAWREICESGDGSSFPGLCGGAAAPTPATAGKLAAPSPGPGDAGAPAPAPAAAKKGPAVAAGGPDCYADPAADACRTFQQSEADSAADISQLCGANPFLVGCSLWGQCRSRAASGAYCQPFSVLGTLCLPNPTLAGCQHWAALCTTPGSAVQQCITAPPLRNAMLTSQTIDGVSRGCSSQTGASISGCQQCRAPGLAGCRDPLGVLSRLCFGSGDSAASLPQCATLTAMCAEAGATFTSLCSGSAAAARSGSPPAAAEPASPASAKMYLHASMSAVIVLQSWVPASGGAYVASCLAIIAVAVAAQGLKALKLRLEARWAAEHAAAAAAARLDDMHGCGSPAGTRSSMDGKDSRRSSNVQAPMLWRSSLGRLIPTAGGPRHQQLRAQQPYITRRELARNTARSALTGAAVWLDYMLMLVVMTFNLGLIISATLGSMLGALAFGHWAERAAGASGPSAPAAGSLQQTGERDPEVPYASLSPHKAAGQPQQPQQALLLVGAHSAPLPL